MLHHDTAYRVMQHALVYLDLQLLCHLLLHLLLCIDTPDGIMQWPHPIVQLCLEVCERLILNAYTWDVYMRVWVCHDETAGIHVTRATSHGTYLCRRLHLLLTQCVLQLLDGISLL